MITIFFGIISFVLLGILFNLFYIKNEINNLITKESLLKDQIFSRIRWIQSYIIILYILLLFIMIF